MNENKLIAEWFKKNHQPDYDGYCGQVFLPEEIMKEYIKMFPNDWDDNEGLLMFVPNFIKKIFKIGIFAKQNLGEEK